MAKFSDTKGRYIQAQAKKTRQDKSNELKESIGSLNRRVQKALSSGDTDQAKDLRSRQNKFATKLGLNEAIRTGGVLRQGGPDGKIVRSSTTGQPIMTSKGHDIFRETKDKYYIDPTRNLQNTNPKAYAKMYPIANALQSGLPGLANLVPGMSTFKSIAKSALSPLADAGGNLRTLAGDMTGRPFAGLFDSDRQIPYANPETQGLPGTEFPLGYAEALGTPEAYNFGNGINDTLANSVDGTAPINVNAAGLDLSDGYQVMDASDNTVTGDGIFSGMDVSGMNLLDYFNLRDNLPGANVLEEGYNKLQDDRGFDIDLEQKQLEYNKPLWGGNLRLFGSPDQSGILYSKELGV